MIKIVIGVAGGAIVGFFYYRLIGCHTGACYITRNPYRSIAYWALVGGLLANIL
jgi:hypothetical protein